MTLLTQCSRRGWEQVAVGLKHVDEHLRAAPKRLVTWRLRTAARAARTRPDDIIVASYPRSGSTWLQAILYQLRSDDGEIRSHLCDVSPTLESHLLRGPREFERARPGVFKTHMPNWSLPRGEGRYIYVLRHGLDVAMSLYHFMKGRSRYAPRAFDEFFDDFIVPGRVYPQSSWFTHVAAGLSAGYGRYHVVTYEELVRSPQSTVEAIAAFCGLMPDQPRLERTLTRTRFEYMHSHQHLFDPMKRKALPACSDDQFIRRGSVGEGVAFAAPAVREAYERETRCAARGRKWPSYLLDASGEADHGR